MSLTKPTLPGVVAGWKLSAWYITKGTSLASFDSRMPLFLHPRYASLMPATGPHPFTEEKVQSQARAALYWMLHHKRNAKAFGGHGGGTIKRRPDDHTRIIIEVEFVVETLIAEVTLQDMLDHPPSDVDKLMMQNEGGLVDA